MLKRADHQSTWTTADLIERFGPMPLSRICFDPPPGTATEEDLLEIHGKSKRLLELVDGTLVEKAIGYLESVIGMTIAFKIRALVKEHDLGIVGGEGSMLHLDEGLVRIPDVTFTSWETLKAIKQPAGSFLEGACDLAVEVISPSNTKKEMDDKLVDFFGKGTQLVWYVYPLKREIHVFTSPTEFAVFDEDGTVAGGHVLPNFSMTVREVFEDADRLRDHEQ